MNKSTKRYKDNKSRDFDNLFTVQSIGPGGATIKFTPETKGFNTSVPYSTRRFKLNQGKANQQIIKEQRKYQELRKKLQTAEWSEILEISQKRKVIHSRKSFLYNSFMPEPIPNNFLHIGSKPINFSISEKNIQKKLPEVSKGFQNSL